MRYQIRTNGHGLALVEAESAHFALVKFFESMGYESKAIKVEENGGITFVATDGTEYYTEPPD